MKERSEQVRNLQQEERPSSGVVALLIHDQDKSRFLQNEVGTDIKGNDASVPSSVKRKQW